MKRRNWNYEILLTCILKILLNNSVDINKQCAFLSFLYECKQKHFPHYIMILKQGCWRFILRIKTILKQRRIILCHEKYPKFSVSIRHLDLVWILFLLQGKLKITTIRFSVARNTDAYVWKIKISQHFSYWRSQSSGH